MEEFTGYHTRPPSSTPYPKLGDGSPRAKFVLRLARKRREIAFRFQQTNFTEYGGLSRGAIPDPLAPPLPQSGGRVEKMSTVHRWLCRPIAYLLVYRFLSCNELSFASSFSCSGSSHLSNECQVGHRVLANSIFFSEYLEGRLPSHPLP